MKWAGDTQMCGTASARLRRASAAGPRSAITSHVSTCCDRRGCPEACWEPASVCLSVWLRLVFARASVPYHSRLTWPWPSPLWLTFYFD